MAIGHLTPKALKAMREHGHSDFWEVATYKGVDDENPDSVTVECTKCGEVLVELVNQAMEEDDPSVYDAACALMRTLDKMEQEGTSQSPDANKLRDALQDLNLTDEEEERLDTYSVELRRKRENVEDDDAWREGEEADCNPIQDIHERVGVGEPMPEHIDKTQTEELTEAKFLDVGYKTRPNVNRTMFAYERLLQKKMPKGYFLDIQVYEHVRFPKNTAFQPHVQFALPNDAMRFNVDLLVKSDTTVEEIEAFFEKLFDQLGCVNDD